MQSAERVLARGLPVNGARWFGKLSRDAELNRLGRVVIGLDKCIGIHCQAPMPIPSSWRYGICSEDDSN